MSTRKTSADADIRLFLQVQDKGASGSAGSKQQRRRGLKWPLRLQTLTSRRQKPPAGREEGGASENAGGGGRGGGGGGESGRSKGRLDKEAVAPNKVAVCPNPGNDDGEDGDAERSTIRRHDGDNVGEERRKRQSKSRSGRREAPQVRKEWSSLQTVDLNLGPPPSAQFRPHTSALLKTQPSVHAPSDPALPLQEQNPSRNKSSISGTSARNRVSPSRLGSKKGPASSQSHLRVLSPEKITERATADVLSTEQARAPSLLPLMLRMRIPSPVRESSPPRKQSPRRKSSPPSKPWPSLEPTEKVPLSHPPKVTSPLPSSFTLSSPVAGTLQMEKRSEQTLESQFSLSTRAPSPKILSLRENQPIEETEPLTKKNEDIDLSVWRENAKARQRNEETRKYSDDWTEKIMKESMHSDTVGLACGLPDARSPNLNSTSTDGLEACTDLHCKFTPEQLQHNLQLPLKNDPLSQLVQNLQLPARIPKRQEDETKEFPQQCPSLTIGPPGLSTEESNQAPSTQNKINDTHATIEIEFCDDNPNYCSRLFSGYNSYLDSDDTTESFSRFSQGQKTSKKTIHEESSSDTFISVPPCPTSADNATVLITLSSHADKSLKRDKTSFGIHNISYHDGPSKKRDENSTENIHALNADETFKTNMPIPYLYENYLQNIFFSEETKTRSNIEENTQNNYLEKQKNTSIEPIRTSNLPIIESGMKEQKLIFESRPNSIFLKGEKYNNTNELDSAYSERNVKICMPIENLTFSENDETPIDKVLIKTDEKCSTEPEVEGRTQNKIRSKQGTLESSLSFSPGRKICHSLNKNTSYKPKNEKNARENKTSNESNQKTDRKLKSSPESELIHFNNNFVNKNSESEFDNISKLTEGLKMDSTLIDKNILLNSVEKSNYTLPTTIENEEDHPKTNVDSQTSWSLVHDYFKSKNKTSVKLMQSSLLKCEKSTQIVHRNSSQPTLYPETESGRTEIFESKSIPKTYSRTEEPQQLATDLTTQVDTTTFPISLPIQQDSTYQSKNEIEQNYITKSKTDSQINCILSEDYNKKYIPLQKVNTVNANYQEPTQTIQIMEISSNNPKEAEYSIQKTEEQLQTGKVSNLSTEKLLFLTRPEKTKPASFTKPTFFCHTQEDSSSKNEKNTTCDHRNSILSYISQHTRHEPVVNNHSLYGIANLSQYPPPDQFQTFEKYQDKTGVVELEESFPYVLFKSSMTPDALDKPATDNIKREVLQLKKEEDDCTTKNNYSKNIEKYEDQRLQEEMTTQKNHDKKRHIKKDVEQKPRSRKVVPFLGCKGSKGLLARSAPPSSAAPPPAAPPPISSAPRASAAPAPAAASLHRDDKRPDAAPGSPPSPGAPPSQFIKRDAQMRSHGHAAVKGLVQQPSRTVQDPGVKPHLRHRAARCLSAAPATGDTTGTAPVGTVAAVARLTPAVAPGGGHHRAEARRPLSSPEKASLQVLYRRYLRSAHAWRPGPSSLTCLACGRRDRPVPIPNSNYDSATSTSLAEMCFSGCWPLVHLLRGPSPLRLQCRGCGHFLGAYDAGAGRLTPAQPHVPWVRPPPLLRPHVHVLSRRAGPPFGQKSCTPRTQCRASLGPSAPPPRQLAPAMRSTDQ